MCGLFLIHQRREYIMQAILKREKILQYVFRMDVTYLCETVEYVDVPQTESDLAFAIQGCSCVEHSAADKRYCGCRSWTTIHAD